VKKTFRLVFLKLNKDLDYMSEQYLTGTVRPVIDGPYELDEIRRAFEIFAEGRHEGKMVVEVRHS
jgi:NADPH:quinone reductase-like Zn-dependent oxidoreductase